MPSELAKKIYQLEWGQIDVIDAELQEVREVLDGLQTGTVDTGVFPMPHWCEPLGQCGEACQRACALYQQLRVDGGKENDGKA